MLQQHLVDQNTESPPIDGAAVFLVEQDLGRHKFGSATESASRAAVPHVFLAETVIGNLDVTVECEENVVEFQITVDDTVFVEVLQGKADLGGVELCALGTELASLNVQHQITTRHVLHDKVDAGLGLETGVQVCQEGVLLFVGNEEHALLRSSRLNFVVLDDEFFLEDLDGVQ